MTRMNRGTLAQSIRFGWPCVPGQSLERDQKKRDRDGSLSRRCAEINAPKNEFFQSFQVDLGCPVSTRKIFPFTKIGNRVLASPSRAAQRGVSRSSRNVARDCGGRVARSDEALVNAGRRSRVVLTPRRWGQPPGQEPGGTGAIKPGTPGRARRSRLKPSRRECRIVRRTCGF